MCAILWPPIALKNCSSDLNEKHIKILYGDYLYKEKGERKNIAQYNDGKKDLGEILRGLCAVFLFRLFLDVINFWAFANF